MTRIPHLSQCFVAMVVLIILSMIMSIGSSDYIGHARMWCYCERVLILAVIARVIYLGYISDGGSSVVFFCSVCELRCCRCFDLVLRHDNKMSCFITNFDSLPAPVM